MEIGNKGPVLFWVEDRMDTVATQIGILNKAEMPFYMYGTPAELTEVLDDIHKEKDIEQLKIGFVIDIMLFGVTDLSSMDIYDAPTGNGIHAGYVFVDRVLRAKQSRYLNKPICFLTERMIDDELKQDIAKLKSRGGGKIEIVQKYKDTELPTFRKFISEI